MNVRDSERMAVLLTRHGHVMAGGEQDADAVIVNTCSVREKAEDKALGKLGLLVKSRRDRPGLVVGVAGCMVQRLGRSVMKRVPGLDFAVGTSGFSRIPDVLKQVENGEGPVFDVSESEESDDALSAHENSSLSAFVTILLGCDRRCAYCIVPDVRGRERSRRARDIVEEVRGLLCRGAREVTLLGQSVMRYGLKDDVWAGEPASPGGFTEPFPRLLEALDGLEGLDRLRFTSAHVSGCSDEFVRVMAECRSTCEHIHLPLQSASDRILSMMGRGYTADQYRGAIAAMRKVAPGLAVTTDVIVGYPTETEEDFECTRAFMEEIGFDNSFIFKYSPRPGTRASELDDDVDSEEKLRRNHILLEDQDTRGLRINRGFVSREVEVLVEGVSLRNPDTWSGRTRTNKIVVFKKEPGLRRGRLVRVRIERAMPQTLYGTVSESMDRDDDDPSI